MADQWEGGRRQGVRWRRLGVAVLVLALAAGGLLLRRDRGITVETGGPPVSGHTEAVEVAITAPLQAGSRWYCPSTFPIRVHEDGRYYPAEYPRGRELLPRPVGCYADVERARADGYVVAEPPPGVVVAGGVYLEPASTPDRSECRAVASMVGFPVPCPTRLPAPGDGPSCQQDSCLYGEFPEVGVVIEQRGYRVPPGWPTANPHLVVAAVEVTGEGHGSTLEVLAHPELVSCNQQSPVRAGRTPAMVVCPAAQTWVPRIQGDPHEEHTTAFWRRGDAVYAASIEGEGAQVDALLAALIEDLEYAAP